MKSNFTCGFFTASFESLSQHSSLSFCFCFSLQQKIFYQEIPKTSKLQTSMIKSLLETRCHPWPLTGGLVTIWTFSKMKFSFAHSIDCIDKNIHESQKVSGRAFPLQTLTSNFHSVIFSWILKRKGVQKKRSFFLIFRPTDQSLGFVTVTEMKWIIPRMGPRALESSQNREAPNKTYCCFSNLYFCVHSSKSVWFISMNIFKAL